MTGVSKGHRALHLSQQWAKLCPEVMWEPREIWLMEKWIPAKEKQWLIFQLQENNQDEKSAGCQADLCGTRSQVFQPLEVMEVSLCNIAGVGYQPCWQTKPLAIISVVCSEPQPALWSLCTGNKLQTHREMVFKQNFPPSIAREEGYKGGRLTLALFCWILLFVGLFCFFF